MGLYVSDDDVKIRLLGKVRFTDDLEDENRMPMPLLRRLVSEAEGQVEYDLSPRYHAPFLTDAGLPFSKVPERPTRNLIKTLVELMSVIRVLETDFGRGTVVEAEKYTTGIQKRYDAIIKQILAKRQHNGQDGFGWMYPPLPGLKLNYMNSESDDGYAGMVLVAGNNDGDYPATRINDPAESFFNFKEEF